MCSSSRKKAAWLYVHVHCVASIETGTNNCRNTFLKFYNNFFLRIRRVDNRNNNCCVSGMTWLLNPTSHHAWSNHRYLFLVSPIIRYTIHTLWIYFLVQHSIRFPSLDIGIDCWIVIYMHLLSNSTTLYKMTFCFIFVPSIIWDHIAKVSFISIYLKMSFLI